MRSWVRQRIKPKDGTQRSTIPYGTPSPANPPRSADNHELSSASLQDRLWNQAYDALKANEPKIVEAYEKFLTTELRRDRGILATTTENEIEATKQRWHQMERLINFGLQRTEKDVAAKQNIGDVLQTVNIVKGMVGTAVQAAPEAAVAWVGVSFALEVLSNPFTEPGINREGLAYVLSRMDWYWNLVCLLLDESHDLAFAGLRKQLEKHVVQLYQKLLLYQMKSVCLYHRKRVAVLFRDMIVLDDWGGQLNEIKDAEAAVRSDSEQYNSHKAQVRLEDLATTAELQYAELKGVTSAIQHQTRRQEEIHRDEQNKECLDDLYETDPRHDKTRIQDTKGGLLRDAYSWILENPDFKQWRTAPDGGLFWVNGDPGKGKTMLLCGIIDELGKDPTHQLSYFFCQATEQKLNNATAVLRGLVYSLADQYPALMSHVRKEYERGGKRQRFEGRNAWEVLSKIFTSMLDDPILDGVVLIVDALDECSAGRPQLLDFVIRVSASYRVKWIVSSRNWPDIEEKLGAATQKVTLRLELNENSISNAVRTYIRHKVAELALLKGYDHATQDAVLQHFMDKSNNTFLWVALVCKELANHTITRNRHTLSQLKKFPLGLDSLYIRMMKQISESRDANLCKEILAVAAVVYRPVTLEELKVLVESIEQDDYEDMPQIIKACGSFLTLREGVMYFVHQSAKDFLLERASNEILPFGATHQHHAIFSKSQAALSKTLKRDLCKLGAPGFLIDQVSPRHLDASVSLHYACVFWVDHLHNSDTIAIRTALQDNGGVHRFIRYKYLYWLELLSLLRSLPWGIKAVHKLKVLVRQMGGQQLTELLRDARRFILAHKTAIEIAPLQAYASALVFSPDHSLIRELFNHEEPDWIILKPSMETDWNECLQTLEGHSDWVKSVVFSADGQRLASGSDDNTVKIWDTETGACLQTLVGHDNWVNSVVLSADGQRLASGSDDKTIKIWNPATGACLQTLLGHDDSVKSVVLSAHDRHLASGSTDKTVKIWDTETGVCLQTLQSHGDSVKSVVFSADGQRLASGSTDKTVKIWDTETGACLQTLLSHGDSVQSVVFLADGQRLASGSDDKTIKIWDPATGACLQTLEGHSRYVSSVAFSADSQRLASGSGDGTIKIWDPATGACLQTLEGHSDLVWSVVFSADGQRLASGSRDETVKIWDSVMGACLQRLEGDSHWVSSVIFSVDGQRLASGSGDGTIKIWDPATGACLQTLQGHSAWVFSLVFSADSQRLASGSGDETIKIWDPETGACLQTLEGHSSFVLPLVLSADGQRLASGSDDKTIKIWDPATGVCLQTLEGHSDLVWSVVFSADGQRLASGSKDKTIKIWDPATSVCLQTLEGHDHSVKSVIFSADGQHLASGSDDKTVKIWISATGTCMQTLEGHSNWVLSSVFSADGQRLASGSKDKTIKIWDPATGACLQTLSVGKALCRLSFDPSTSTRLSTEIGLLNLDMPSLAPDVGIQLTREAILQPASHVGYGLSSDGLWVMRDGDRVLWLPSEYRLLDSAVFGSKLAIGSSSGRILVMGFL